MEIGDVHSSRTDGAAVMPPPRTGWLRKSFANFSQLRGLGSIAHVGQTHPAQQQHKSNTNLHRGLIKGYHRNEQPPSPPPPTLCPSNLGWRRRLSETDSSSITIYSLVPRWSSEGNPSIPFTYIHICRSIMYASPSQIDN